MRRAANCTRWLAVATMGTALVGAVTGCPSTASTTTYPPITGIEIDPSSMLAGLECGTAPDQVFEYVAVVWQDADGGRVKPAIASNVFDCFATGVFENLSPDGAPASLVVDIFAFSKGCLRPDLTCAGGLSAQPCSSTDAGFPPAGPQASFPAGMVPQWETTCTAVQQQGAPGFVVCPRPLTPTGHTCNAAGSDAGGDGEG